MSHDKQLLKELMLKRDIWKLTPLHRECYIGRVEAVQKVFAIMAGNKEYINQMLSCLGEMKEAQEYIQMVNNVGQ